MLLVFSFTTHLLGVEQMFLMMISVICYNNVIIPLHWLPKQMYLNKGATKKYFDYRLICRLFSLLIHLVNKMWEDIIIKRIQKCPSQSPRRHFSLWYSFCPNNGPKCKDIWVTITQGREKQQIFTSGKLESRNVWHFCSKEDWNDSTISVPHVYSVIIVS